MGLAGWQLSFLGRNWKASEESWTPPLGKERAERALLVKELPSDSHTVNNNQQIISQIIQTDLSLNSDWSSESFKQFLK